MKNLNAKKVKMMFLSVLFPSVLLAGGNGTSKVDAIDVSVGTFTADNSAGNYWYRFDADKSQVVRVSSCGLTNENSFLKIYRNDDETPTVYNDDFYGTSSQLDIHVPQGEHIYLVWADENTSATFSWTLTEVDRSNDLFQKDYSAGLDKALYYGDFEWYDENRDGKLDIFGTGFQSDGSAYLTRYINGGDNTFVEKPYHMSFIGLTHIDIATFDNNNDNYVDMLGAGNYPAQAQDFFTLIEYNESLGEYVLTSESDFTPFALSSISIGDFDNDGDDDVITTGTKFYVDEQGTPYTYVYENVKGEGYVKRDDINLKNLFWGSVQWVDIDNDADLDIFISGFDDNYKSYTKLYTNDEGTFNEQADNIIEYAVDADFADIDNDGDLDLLACGFSFDANHKDTSIVYLNNDGVFEYYDSFIGIHYGQAQFGDYDNDGDPDVIISGYNYRKHQPITAVFEKTEDGYTELENTIEGVYQSMVKWADADNDGDLDFFISGSLSTDNWADHDPEYDTRSTEINLSNGLYINTGKSANTTPLAPQNIDYRATAGTVEITWEAPANFSNSYGGSYNIAIGTTPGGTDIVSPLALEDGTRLVAALGNNGATTKKILNLAGGKYYFRVQAIDHAYEGGAFTEEVEINVPYHLQELAFVSYDNVANKWKLAWRDESGYSTDYYKFYRESTEDNSFDEIGTVDYSDDDIFIDEAFEYGSYSPKYKMSLVDSLGNTSALSDFHKPIFLTVSIDDNTDLPTLNWTKYEGREYDKYYIFRGLDGLNMKLIDSIPASDDLTFYRDQSWDGKAYKYQVGIKVSIANINGLKSESGPFSQSMSNLSEAVVVSGINSEIGCAGLDVYPNPVSSTVAISSECFEQEAWLVQIFNESGQLLISDNVDVKSAEPILLDIAKLPQGVYLLVMQNSTTVLHKRIEKN